MSMKSSFFKNVLVMLTGTAFSQILTMLSSPLITRIYGPENYGVMSTLIAIAGIVAPIAALTFPIAIVLPKKDKEAIYIIFISIFVTAIFTILTFVLIFLFKNELIELFALENIYNYLYLIPLIIFSAGIVQTLEQWIIRKQQFKTNAKIMITHSVTNNATKIGLGYYYPNATVLVVITSLASTIKVLLLMVYLKIGRSKLINVYKLFNIKRIKQTFIKYSDFPVFRAPEVFLTAISSSLPVFLLASLFGPVSVAYYTLSRSTLDAPTQIIGQSVGDVFYPKIALAKNNNENVNQMIIRSTLLLAGIGFIPFLILFLFSSNIFGVVFGEDWVTAGEYAKWFAIWSFTMFVNRPSVRALPVLNAQKLHLFFSITMLIIRSISLYIGFTIFKNDVISVALFCVSGAALNLILIIITLNISKQTIKVNKLLN